MINDSKRRKELGAFLKERRSRLAPEEFGLHSAPHRRAKGLRREEVAGMAGVSNIWYTWLEQGRDVRPSVQVLESLGRVLRLNRYELTHLFTLAEQRPPGDDAPPAWIAADPSLQRLLDKLEPYPAYIRGPRWDTLAWNAAACELYGDFSLMNELERNSLWRMFVRLDYPDMLPDWQQAARNLLAQFRASYGRNVGHPRFEELIDTLKQSSETFAEWWDRHDVLGIPLGTKRFKNPKLGELAFAHQTLTIADHPDLKLTVYLPVVHP